MEKKMNNMEKEQIKLDKKLKSTILIITFLFFGIMSVALLLQSVGITTDKEIKYSENGDSKYRVYLNDKSYYNKEFLDEGMQYISSIIDYVNVDFNYSNVFNKELNYNVFTKAMIDLNIVDTDDNNKVIYKSSEILKGEKTISKNNEKNMFVSDNFKINYNRYNKIANDFKTNYGISAKCSIVVTYYVNYDAINSDFDKKISNSKKMSVTIPLSEQMISITKTPSIKTESSFKQSSTKETINYTLFMVSMIFALISILSLIIFIRYKMGLNIKKSKYEKYISKLLKQYDGYITESTNEVDLNKKQVIEVKDFSELLDVRNNEEKPIIFERIHSQKCYFIILGNKEVYRYVVRAIDFE